VRRFPTQKVKEIIRAVLLERLGEGPPYHSEIAKGIADTIRTRLKGMGGGDVAGGREGRKWWWMWLTFACAALELPRYKYVVQVVVGENKGEGARVSTRCMWDPATDALATESFTNDAIFAVATAYGVYLY
jgi:hypothetical protein